ncbi:hypothetical protein F511_08602 [Dorcoceras hygrometricum]|uniref:Uncharacterized protein n=1 Tax=Dorcoceras hygrometricum TaxID=472368 RepID=A0A2Z7BGM7_9LAMI|nr:hypothetical protein F511_08602 [Dorcoceras hygrometricum]
MASHDARPMPAGLALMVARWSKGTHDCAPCIARRCTSIAQPGCATCVRARWSKGTHDCAPCIARRCTSIAQPGCATCVRPCAARCDGSGGGRPANFPAALRRLIFF